MAKAFETRNVVQYCFGNDVLKNLLPHLLEQLEVCQKALSGYLDQKRAAFPRFYFVSDAVLLEVLSQGSNPEAIQAHLASVFDSIDSIEFDRVEKTKVISMSSSDGEYVPLVSPVKAEGNIEDWLNQLLLTHQKTINNVVKYAALDCETMAIDEFTYKYPSQVSLIGIQFIWTLDSEDALYRSKTEKGVMNSMNRKNLQRLNVGSHARWPRTRAKSFRNPRPESAAQRLAARRHIGAPAPIFAGLAWLPAVRVG